jgi:hypothetical protein
MSHSEAQMQMQTLVVRVLSLQNLEGDFVTTLEKHSHSGVSVYCDAFEQRREVVSLSPHHGLKKGSEVSE